MSELGEAWASVSEQEAPEVPEAWVAAVSGPEEWEAWAVAAWVLAAWAVAVWALEREAQAEMVLDWVRHPLPATAAPQFPDNRRSPQACHHPPCHPVN